MLHRISGCLQSHGVRVDVFYSQDESFGASLGSAHNLEQPVYAEALAHHPASILTAQRYAEKWPEQAYVKRSGR